MAEYRKGSILARIEELEVATNPEFRFENTREEIEYYKAVGELKAYKELKAMVEARRDEKLYCFHKGAGAVEVYDDSEACDNCKFKLKDLEQH